MPITREYKAGAVIYFEGDKSDDVYVLKEGKVSLRYRGIETNQYVNERLRIGEFFGVKSAIGRYKREETAQVDADASVLILTVKEFDELSLKNIGLVLKMLKIFSTQLRKVGKQAAELLATSELTVLSSEGLFQVGDYYLKNKRFDHALYAFHKYLEQYPDADLVHQAKDRIDLAQKGVSTGFQSPLDDSFIDDGQELKMEPEQDDEELEQLYEEAVDLLDEQNYKDALTKLIKVSNSNNAISEKAKFQVARCYYELEDSQKAIEAFTSFVKEHPGTELLKSAIFYIGKSYHSQGDDDKAVGFYTKVLNMPSEDDSLSDEAKELIEEIKS